MDSVLYELSEIRRITIGGGRQGRWVSKGNEVDVE